MSILSHLNLPPIERIEPLRYNDYYGASRIAARYCGLRQTPRSERGWWQHGWLSRRCHFDPMILLHVDHHEPNYWPFLVARREDEAYLRGAGIERVEAIGLPLAYLPPSQQPRRPNSLLVMPVHSLEYTRLGFAFDAYADAIDSVRDAFDEILVCVHPSCMEHGYWVKQFTARGFEVVTGAHYLDGNGLLRMQALMTGVEYVTSNGVGSHLPYAAALGAKVSLFGPFAAYRPEDFATDPFYTKHPHLLSPRLEANSEAAMREDCPWLFCHPREARLGVEWGAREVGVDCRREPRELQKLLGWTPPAWYDLHAQARQLRGWTKRNLRRLRGKKV